TPHPGSPLLRFVGQDVDAGAGGFKEFDIAVTVASTVKVCVSDQRQADNATSVNATVSATISAAGTVAQPGDVPCANGVATQIAAGNANGLSVIVRSSAGNSYSPGQVRIGTTAVTAASGIEINPGETQTWAVTAPIFCFNNTGAGISLQVEPLAK
ncbi:MAG: hypothetical protein KGL35_00030, partial [Bradyrhizobium sp.]|nr:hypothetical protein [Bradyrhizobium sp.]